MARISGAAFSPNNIVTISAILLLCICQSAFAGKVEDDKVSPLFQSNEPLSLTISAPFSTLNLDRDDDRDYQPATLTMTDRDGQEIRLDLEIRVRGNFRARRDICSNPPLKLNFKRKSLANTIFEGENKLKLVDQCKNFDYYEQYLLLEYLNYRVYQLFTDDSLRVRLATVNYYDSEDKRDLGTRKSFFIEDISRMAKRLGMKEVHQERLQPGDYDPTRMNLVDLFEYFIGNTDWSSLAGPQGEECCHNIIPLSPRGGSLIPVPYDFDLAGMVNARYAEVSDLLPIRSVRQRLYRGYCPSDAVLQKTIAAFIEKRDEIKALYEKQPGLTERSVNYTLKYIDDFYDTIQDRNKLNRAIMQKCR